MSSPELSECEFVGSGDDPPEPTFFSHHLVRTEEHTGHVATPNLYFSTVLTGLAACWFVNPCSRYGHLF